MIFDLYWAALGSSVMLAILAVLFVLKLGREVFSLRERLRELIDNYNALLIILRVRQPEIFGKIDEPGQVSGIPASTGSRTETCKEQTSP